MSETQTETKEAHRLGTINRWDAPEGDWAAEYDWTRYRGPDPWPVPGGWVFNDPEGGGHWQYFGDAGVGHHDDNSILDKLKDDDDIHDPYDELDDRRGPRAGLQVETANPDDVSLRNPEDEELEWTLEVAGEEIFRRVEPDRSDLMAAVAEALAAYHEMTAAVEKSLGVFDEGGFAEHADEFTPSTGRVPDDIREQEGLEERKKKNGSLDDFATGGGQ